MFVHDLIKILYVNEGYLPNYPYHMVTDHEMFDAFLRDDGFFAENYPCVNSDLQDAYDTLLEYIQAQIAEFEEDGTELPGWIYAYMMGHVISVDSDMRDIQELYDLCGEPQPNPEAQFTAELSQRCYEVSCEWLRKQSSESSRRPPSVFGEPHVYKSLRLSQVDILTPVQGG